MNRFDDKYREMYKLLSVTPADLISCQEVILSKSKSGLVNLLCEREEEDE